MKLFDWSRSNATEKWDSNKTTHKHWQKVTYISTNSSVFMSEEVDITKSLDGSIVFTIKHRRCTLRIQCMIRQSLAYKKFLKQANISIEKILDPHTSKEVGVDVYYYYHKVLQTSRWEKPSYLGSNDIEQIAPTYTEEQAAIMVQNTWRKRMVKHKTTTKIYAYIKHIYTPSIFISHHPFSLKIICLIIC